MTAETILIATDSDGSTVKIHQGETSWCWQFQNSKRHEFDYGWALSASEAILKSQKLLKPDGSGLYPTFQVVEVNK